MTTTDTQPWGSELPQADEAGVSDDVSVASTDSERLDVDLPPQPVINLVLYRGFLTILTLGIYRFWMVTYLRQMLWSAVSLKGDRFEYTGYARELLIGFLIALAIIIPLNMAVFFVTLGSVELANLGTLALLVVFVLLGQFAYYRARRYRLTRTVYRGVRFWQTGSAVGYAARWTGWTIASFATLGLLEPYKIAALTRYRVTNTRYGDQLMTFSGTGASLYKRIGVLLVLLFLPLLAFIYGLAFVVDWASLGPLFDELETLPLEQQEQAYEVIMTNILSAVGPQFLAIIAICLAVLPILRARILVWTAENTQLGGMSFSSDLKGRSVLGTYIVFFVGVVLFVGLVGLVMVAVFTAAAGFIAALAIDPGPVTAIVLSVLSVFLIYGPLFLAYDLMRTAYLRRKLWILDISSITVHGVSHLDDVVASGERSSAFGEGLADALDMGGM